MKGVDKRLLHVTHHEAMFIAIQSVVMAGLSIENEMHDQAKAELQSARYMIDRLIETCDDQHQN